MCNDSIRSSLETRILRLIICLAVLVVAGEAGADPFCSSPFSHAVGTSPYAAAVGDLNGDTFSDIVTANSLSHDVSVLLGHGNGLFQAAVAYPVGVSPRDVVVADVNGDLVPDVVAVSTLSKQVNVLLGNGDGTLQAVVSYPTVRRPYSLAVVDVDGDGAPDVVTGNRQNDNVGVLLGNGDGTFGAAVLYAAGDAPNAVVAANLDAGSDPDLATASTDDDGVSVLLGNGDGSFGAPALFAAGIAPGDVAAADLDGDTIIDLVSANPDTDDVNVLRGNGNGTFGAASSFAAGNSPRSVAVADLDGDSAPDVVTANEFSNDVSVLLGNGDGTFQAAVSCAAGARPLSVAVADFDSDTVLDIAAANNSGDDVTVSFNLSGPFVPPAVVSFGRQAARPDGETYDGNPVTVSDAIDLDSGNLVFDELAQNGLNMDLDCVHSLPNGNMLFSAEPWIFGLPDLGAVPPGDIVEYDVLLDQFSLYFSANNFVGLGNVDACAILPNGNLLLSSKGPAELPGLGAFQDGDLVEWDGAAASLFMAEASIFTFGANNSVDAVHHTGDSVLISPRTAGIGTIGSNGLSYRFDESDVFEIDLGTGEATRFLNGELLWDGSTRQTDAVTLIAPATCPCWTEEEIDEDAFPKTRNCGTPGNTARLIAQKLTSASRMVAFARLASPAVDGSCKYEVASEGIFRNLTVTPAEAQACYDSVIAECAVREEE